MPMARWARETGVIAALHRVHGRRPLERLAARRGRAGRRARSTLSRAIWPPEPVDPGYRGEVAERWRYADGRGEFGVISSVTRPFCRDCTRARLSADGKLYTCLFAVGGRDVRAVLRDGSTDAELARVPRRRSGRRGTTATRSFGPGATPGPAEDRDVRDGRLTRPPLVHTVIHTPSTAVPIPVDIGREIGRDVRG